MIAALALALVLIPMHGTMLAASGANTAIVRNDEIPATLASGTHEYRLQPMVRARAGTGIDGLLDRSTTPWTLRNAIAAPAFSPGAPESGKVIAVDISKPVPDAALVDQDGHPVHLAS
ncbi:MAG TPA: hypothetical protein VGN11_06950, partial [Candidatus Baltobacteraceae bacterium]|nr:hypothetical protein [Candidatus Baltobacteraceae bacterium]